MITLMITVMETGCILAESGPVKSFDSELRVNFLRRSVCHTKGRKVKKKEVFDCQNCKKGADEVKYHSLGNVAILRLVSSGFLGVIYKLSKEFSGDLRLKDIWRHCSQSGRLSLGDNSLKKSSFIYFILKIWYSVIYTKNVQLEN